jgi:hypothetical protein
LTQLNSRERVEQALPTLRRRSRPSTDAPVVVPKYSDGDFSSSMSIASRSTVKKLCFFGSRARACPRTRRRSRCATPRASRRAGARHRLERHDVDDVGIVRVHDDREAEVARQPLRRSSAQLLP